MEKLTDGECSIPGFRRYSIDRNGQVFSCVYKKRKMLCHAVDRLGYHAIVLWDNGKSKRFSIHRLVAEMFIPNPLKKPEINHKSGIKSDNRVENLEWCTRSENVRHAVKTGLLKGQVGTKNPGCKITEDQAIEIKHSPLSNKHFRQKYGLEKSTINKIRNGSLWSHLEKS